MKKRYLCIGCLAFFATYGPCALTLGAEMLLKALRNWGTPYEPSYAIGIACWMGAWLMTGAYVIGYGVCSVVRDR